MSHIKDFEHNPISDQLLERMEVSKKIADSLAPILEQEEKLKRIAEGATAHIPNFEIPTLALDAISEPSPAMKAIAEQSKAMKLAIGQSEEWEIDITCENCGTRYSVIGSAYFCPCCGHNSAVSAFEESMDSVEKMLASLSEMKQMLTTSYGRDKAETMCRGLLESSIGDIVSAFQKFASCHYDKLTGKTSRVNDFQIVDKGSQLFKDATGKGYDEWLSVDELKDMNLLFQRRHLIEHNNGMVDQKYIDKSGDNSYAVGQRLVVKGSDPLTLLAIIKKLGKGLVSLKEVPEN